MPQFARYIGIDYSGAETAESSCKRLRVYVAEGSGTPVPVPPPPSPRRYWTRRGLAEWLCKELEADAPTIVGIDHGFSFPIEYFDRHSLPATGRTSCSTSRNIGQPTNRIPISTSSETAMSGTAPSEWARIHGSASRKGGPQRRNRSSFSTYKALSTNRRSPDSRGFFICEIGASGQSTSGHSTAGRFPRASQSLQRSTRLFG